MNVYFSTNVVNVKIDGSYASMDFMWNWLREPVAEGGGADALVTFNHPGGDPQLSPFDGGLPHNAVAAAVPGGANWNDVAYVPTSTRNVAGMEVNGGDDIEWYVKALTNGWHIGAGGQRGRARARVVVVATTARRCSDARPQPAGLLLRVPEPPHHRGHARAGGRPARHQGALVPTHPLLGRRRRRSRPARRSARRSVTACRARTTCSVHMSGLPPRSRGRAGQRHRRRPGCADPARRGGLGRRASTATHGVTAPRLARTGTSSWSARRPKPTAAATRTTSPSPRRSGSAPARRCPAVSSATARASSR